MALRSNPYTSTFSAVTVRGLTCVFLLPGVLFVVLPRAAAQSAGTWNKRGQNAEVRQEYDKAYEAYRQAHLKKPNDLRYKTRFEAVKALAAAEHVDRGRVLKASGDLGGALNEFSRALAIDPSDQTAQQEIDLIQRQPAATGTPPPGSMEQMAGQDQTLKDISSMSAPVDLQPVSNDPITLHMVEDVKVIYQAIGKAAGLNVLFDPDYSSKRIPVDLTSVSLSDALRIVGTIAGTFYKPITTNTIFVAQNTRTKRTDLDELAVQTFYLTNVSQPNDGNEIQTAVRNLLDPSTKIYFIPSQNALILRATPDQLLLAQKLINDLDRTRPEVIVDVAVLEVNRDKMRRLGLSLPQQFTIAPQSSTTSASTTTTGGTGTTTTTGGTTSTGGNLTLNQLGHFNATNFAVTIGTATVDALLSDSDTRILQNPRIRATDGQRATLKIGSKIPVATGSFGGGGVGGVGGAAGALGGFGVQTQFTYLDVGVNIDMTPTVHYDREVTLKMKIEVSQQNGSVTISGVTEPIISQRVIDQVIQLREGEPSILAGILQKQDTRTSSGTPGLGEIPLLKYFFGSQFRESQQDEIVFLLIPHIVRESVLSRLNTRAIDTGTGASIELRHDTSGASAGDALQPVIGPRAAGAGSPTSAANAASAMVQQMQQQAQPRTSVLPVGTTPQTPDATPATAGGALPPISLNVQPSSSNQTVGSTFQVAVMMNNARDVFSVPLQLQFDPKILQLVNVDAGDFLGRDGQAVALVHRDEGNGLVTISASRPPNTAGVSGQGNICTLTFKATAAGDSNLALVKVGARNSAQGNLSAVGTQAVVHVK